MVEDLARGSKYYPLLTDIDDYADIGVICHYWTVWPETGPSQAMIDPRDT